MTRINLMHKKPSLWKRFRNTDFNDLSTWRMDVLLVVSIILLIIMILFSFKMAEKEQEVDLVVQSYNAPKIVNPSFLPDDKMVKICYENGYYEYDLGYCKRIVNGTTEVIGIDELNY